MALPSWLRKLADQARQFPRRLTPRARLGTSGSSQFQTMSKQYNKGIKKQRRLAYKKRLKARVKQAKTAKAAKA